MVTYFPVLKTKSAEFKALDNLHPDLPELRPLLEVIPRPTRKTPLTNEQWYREISLGVLQQAETRPVLIDPYLMSSRDSECTEAGFFTHMASMAQGSPEPAPIIPVVRLHSNAELLSAASALADIAKSGFSVRLTATEIADAGKDRGLELNGALDTLVAGLRTTRSNVDLVIDMGQLQDGSTPQLYVNSLGLALPGISSDWRRIVIAGTTGPDKNDIAQFAEAVTPRLELAVWKELQTWPTIDSELHFGDYAGFAAVLPTGAGRTKHPSLRYTTEGSSYLVRRKAEAGAGFSVFKEVCEHVTRQPWFAGAKFSWGDNHISRTATGDVNPSGGGAIGWRAASVNHHMTLTAAQIASPRVP